MIHERLTYYIEYKGFTKKEFCSEKKFNYDSFVNMLAGKLPIGMKVFKQIKSALPELSVEWLLFNNGDMEINTTNIVQEPSEVYKKLDPKNYQEIINLLNENLKDKSKIISGLEFQITTLNKELEAKKNEIYLKSDENKKIEISNNNG